MKRPVFSSGKQVIVVKKIGDSVRRRRGFLRLDKISRLATVRGALIPQARSLSDAVRRETGRQPEFEIGVSHRASATSLEIPQRVRYRPYGAITAGGFIR